MDISVIIVNYNTKQLLLECLHSIFKQTKTVSFEIIVSDNGSSDGSIEMLKKDFPQVILIENKVNLGFGKANNVAAKVARGKYLLFLNSDTLLLNNALKEFFDFAEKNGRGIYGGILTDANGILVHSYERFTTSSKGLFRCVVQSYQSLATVSSFLRRKKSSLNNSIECVDSIQFIIGADLFILASDFSELNGFDDHFFMYFEDEDLCRRAAIQKIMCHIVPKARIVHLESRSTKIKAKKIEFFEHSFLFYAKRYYSYFQNQFIHFFFFIYMVIRFFDLRFSFDERKSMFLNIIKSL